MYYLPIWVSGKYDKNTHSAIIYNLIAGLSFFFEDIAADIIGIFLSKGKNNPTEKSYFYGIAELTKESIDGFIDDLLNYGILSTVPSSQNLINEYRTYLLSEYNSNNIVNTNSTEVIMSTSAAENAYIKRTQCKAAIVMLELTYSCSEKCIHCYNPNAVRDSDESNLRGKEGYINFAKYKSIIDELAQQGTIKVCLTGGDPFSHPDAWKIIEYLSIKDIAFDIFTNAQALIGHEKRLADFFPASVAVSIYSSDEDIHDSITRIKGSYKRSIEVLQKLHDLCVPLVIKCVIMQSNVNTYSGVNQLAKHLNATVQFDCRLIDSIDGDLCIRESLRLTEDQLKMVYRDPKGMYYVGPDAIDYGKILRKPNEPACLTGQNNICITPQGNVIPCCCFHSVIGNICKQRISEILESKSLDRLTHLPISEYEECGTHPYCEFCVLCPGLNYNEHGTPLKAGENNCYYAKIRYQVFCDLKNGLDPLQGRPIDDALKNISSEHPRIKKHLSKNHLDTNLDEVL